MIDRRSLLRITSAIAGAIGLPFGRAGAEVTPAAPAKVSPRARDMTDEIQAAIDDHNGTNRPGRRRRKPLSLSRFGPDPVLITRSLRVPRYLSIVGPIVIDARQVAGPCIEVCGPRVSIGSMSILLGPQATHAIETNGWDTFMSSVTEHVADV